MIDQEHQNIYLNLLAGRLPVGSNSLHEVVYNHVYGLTGETNIHACVHEHNGFVYYFSVESLLLASTPLVQVPFTEYLPGAASYQGDGAYLMQGIQISAVMLLEGNGLRLLCNAPEVVQELIADSGLPVFEVDQQVGKVLTSVPHVVMGLSQRAGRWLMRGSLTLLTLSAMAYLGVQAASISIYSPDDAQTTSRAVEAELNSTLKKLNVQQPLARQISKVQKVAATTVRSGGWIEHYNQTDQGDEEYEVVLPSWVSRDYLDALGSEVVTELRDFEGLLTVRKEKKKDK